MIPESWIGCWAGIWPDWCAWGPVIIISHLKLFDKRAKHDIEKLFWQVNIEKYIYIPTTVSSLWFLFYSSWVTLRCLHKWLFSARIGNNDFIFYLSWDWINFNFTSSFLRSYKAALLSSFLLLENNHGWLKLIYTVLFSKYNFSWTWRYYLCQHGFKSYRCGWESETRYPGTTTNWKTENRASSVP